MRAAIPLPVTNWMTTFIDNTIIMKKEETILYFNIAKMIIVQWCVYDVYVHDTEWCEGA